MQSHMRLSLQTTQKQENRGLAETPEDYSEDINKVLTNLYISDRLAARNKKLLNDLCIKHILVVGFELKPYHESHFNYVHLPLRDNKKQMLLPHLEQTNQFIEKAIKNKESVLVHCAQGKSRSASLVIAYLMSRYKMGFQQSFNFLKRKRREIEPNEGFIHQLKRYQRILNEQNTN